MVNQYFIIDFDSTLVKDETLEELAKIALKNHPQINEIMSTMQEITKLGMEGKIPYPESLGRRIKLFAANKSHIDEYINILKTRITDSVLDNKSFFLQNAENIYIISGGFKEYILPITSDLGIPENHVLANTFIFDYYGNIIGVDTANVLTQEGGKVKQVEELNLDGEIHVIGDGFTDYQIKQKEQAHTFTAFVENVSRPNVVKNGDYVAKSFDDVINNFR